MEYFVSPSGNDTNPGSQDRPFRSVGRGVSVLLAGDVLNLRHGVYVESVNIVGKRGTADDPIVIRSYPGEHAYIHGTLTEFRRPNNDDWIPARSRYAEAVDDEYVSAMIFTYDLVNRGAFLDRNPYTRLVSYSNINDLRADNETFDKIFDENDPRPGPAVTDEDGNPLGYRHPWVYMGPGIHFNADTRRVHVRLSHTHNNVPRITDYAEEIDPRRVPLAITPRDLETLRIAGSSHLHLERLTINFGGDNSIVIQQTQNLTLDHVRIRAATRGIRMGGPAENPTRDIVFAHCQLEGGVPSWYFRTDRKSVYHFLDGASVVPNNLGENTSETLLLGNPNNTAVEIHHCEFLNGHDIFLQGQGVDFHHNWINNLQDDGLALGFDGGTGGPITVTKIHDNVITRTLTGFSFGRRNQSTQWYIYRNLIDLRAPTRGFRPRHVGDTNVWRYGHLHKSVDYTVGPHDLFQNTLLTYDQREQASFLHYRNTTGPHRRRSLNNVFVAVNPGPESDQAITFVPSPAFPGPTDGNLYHRIGFAAKEPFRHLGYRFQGQDFPDNGTFADLRELRDSVLFDQSKTQYPPGYEANSLLADPQFRRIDADGRPRENNDLRLGFTSPALGAGVRLPEELGDLDPFQPETGNPDIGCYPEDAEPLRVGVDGCRSFPEAPGPHIPMPPTASFIFAVSQENFLKLLFDASGSHAAEGKLVAFDWQFGDGQKDSGSNAVHTYAKPGTYSITLTVTDEMGLSGATTQQITVEDVKLPPDPSAVAPSLNQGVATTVFNSTDFLYTGQNPIQVDVTEGTIEPKRIVVLRGQVLNRENQPLTGVKVSILDHPEFGSTLTRSDGMFDMAANGGGLFTVRYEKTGLLTVQRQSTVPWQDFIILPNVVMIPADEHVTLIDLSTDIDMQVARGSDVSDADGERKATLLFPRGTKAELALPDGSVQFIENLHVRATEFTVGSNGPAAMPGELPATSGYTYAVEFTVDEAVSAGAAEVRFSPPLIHYLENFLALPAGTAIPVGAYDRGAAAWIPADNGRVVKVVAVTGGLAELDVDGSGEAADATKLAELGVTEAERRQLANLYEFGESLWRVPITHFSPRDCNWPYGPPPDAQAPDQPKPEKDDREDDPCNSSGSVIECQNQILGESIDVVGTPFSLNYRSDRVVGRLAAYTLDISLTANVIPASLKRIELEIQIAGRRIIESFQPQPGLRHRFTWDGKDAYNRTLQGAQPARTRIGYVYQPVGMLGSEVERGFGRFSDSGIPIEGSRARQEITIFQEQTSLVGLLDARGRGLGGWSLSEHHAYDFMAKTLYLGDGARRTGEGLNVDRQITTVAGAGPLGDAGDGGPAIEAHLARLGGLAVAPDGSVYISDRFGLISPRSRIRRVDPGGIITTVAGTTSGFSGDGGPATQAQLSAPQGVDIGADGSLYIADFGNHRIRRIGPDGIITTVAGSGSEGFAGDEGPATEAAVQFPHDVAVGPDGTLYISQPFGGFPRVRRVGPDGIITTIVGGNATGGVFGDGGPANNALCFPHAIAIGRDGSLYIAETVQGRVRRVTPDGIINTVAGTGQSNSSGDGGPAIEAGVLPTDVAIGGDGNLFISELGHRIRRVAPDGIITTVAGTGIEDTGPDQVAATKAQIGRPQAVAIGPDETVYLLDTPNPRIIEGVLLPSSSRVRRLISLFPGFAGAEFQIPSEDGTLVYVFDSTGRHLATLNALTNVPLYRFEYDAEGRLKSITDGDENVTSIEYDADGNPRALLAPFGQRTSVSVTGDGYLASITNPAGETTQFSYMNNGLLSTLADPEGNIYRFAYDLEGRLINVEDPDGGSTALLRAPTDLGFEVRLITKMLRETAYRVHHLATGEKMRESACCGGGKIVAHRSTDATDSIAYPDGTNVVATNEPDPLWGMLASVAKTRTTTTASGLSATVKCQLTAELADPQNPLTVKRLTETITINGQSNVEIFDAQSLKLSSRTPSGRESTTLYDPQGRVTETQIADLLPVKFAYNSRGQLAKTVHGSNISSFEYDDRGDLASLTDAISRSTRFERDPLGRVTKRTLPDGREILFTYDKNSNLTSLLLSGRSLHSFTYTATNLQETYIPPDVGRGNTSIRFKYNADRQLERITKSDGQTINYDYDEVGRLRSLITQRGNIQFRYDATTGTPKTITAIDGGQVAYEYDGSLLTKTTWSGLVSGSVRQAYSNDFILISQQINEEPPLEFGYDPDELLTQAGELSLMRNPQNGMLIQTILGNVTDLRTYDGVGALESYTVAAVGNTLFTARYTRDLLSRVIQKIEILDGNSRTFEYFYDDAGNVAEVRQDGSFTSQFHYDENGNRLSHVTPTGTENGFYDDQDRLLRYGNEVFVHSANGEISTRLDTTNNIQTNYEFDPLGNLVAISASDGRQIKYLVDGVGRRIGKRLNGTLIQKFLYQDSLSLVATLDANNTLLSRFIYASSEIVPDYLIRADGATFRIVADPMGSVRFVINAQTGQIAQKLDYDVFGNIIEDTSPGFQPFGFAGGIYDADVGLVHFGARDYDPRTGRWVTRDPILFDGGQTNLYTYVGNDPVNFSDPSGLYVNLFIGCASSVITGGTLSKMTGDCYDLGDAIFDCAVGAASVGLFNRLRKIYRLSRLRNFATKQGMARVAGKKGVEKYLGPNGVQLEIKFARNVFNKSTILLHEGSWVERARILLKKGTAMGVKRAYWDPFTGAIGPMKSAAAHIPLEANIREALNLGVVSGTGGSAARSPCPCD